MISVEICTEDPEFGRFFNIGLIDTQMSEFFRSTGSVMRIMDTACRRLNDEV